MPKISRTYILNLLFYRKVFIKEKKKTNDAKATQFRAKMSQTSNNYEIALVDHRSTATFKPGVIFPRAVK